MGFSHQDVKDILSLLDASPFDEMHLETDGLKLTVRRNATAGGDSPQNAASAPPAAAGRPAEPKRPGPPPPTAPAPAPGDGTPVTAPLLGTFYRAPKPGAPPFVEVGSQVEPDTVVGIIEVMKLMNSVTAGLRGEVVEICAADAQLVEYGQVLLRVKSDTP